MNQRKGKREVLRALGGILGKKTPRVTHGPRPPRRAAEKPTVHVSASKDKVSLSIKRKF